MAFEPLSQLMRGLTGRFSRDGQNLENAQHMAFLRQMKKEQKQQEELMIPLDQLRFVVVDMETTGFHPEKGDEMISLGAVAIEGGQIQSGDPFYSLVKAGREVPQEIVELTSISDEDLNEAREPSIVLGEFFHFAGKSVLVAHHANHERAFFEQYCRSCFKTPFSHRLLDTSFFYKLVDPQFQQIPLDELCRRLGIANRQRHHAFYDAKATAEICCYYLEKVKAAGCVTLNDLYGKLAQL
ncbi:exonuclease domain-containing protein [Bacillus testis]|uniref:exonuclease domain-containing protein n=1 Tax=Bacillus testis TaxID=1622072 RepID=UPI00067EF88F|nr:exonuclease domain-containing protein [Bacillus testis]